MNVGITGSRLLPPARRAVVEAALAALPADARLITGGAVGVDAFAAAWWHRERWDVTTILPAADAYRDPNWTWACTRHEQLAPSPYPYRARNARIVALSDLLLAFPMREEAHSTQRRSGTWQTVRLARAAGVPVHVYILAPYDRLVP